MAKQTINIGTAANDGTGDPLRSAFTKVNSNFTELYEHDANNVLPGQTGNSGKYLTTDGTSTSWATIFDGTYSSLTGKPTIPADISELTDTTNLLTSLNLSSISSSIIPDQDVQYDLGSPTNKFRDLYLSGNTITLGTAKISTDAAGNVSIPGIRDLKFKPDSLYDARSHSLSGTPYYNEDSTLVNSVIVDRLTWLIATDVTYAALKTVGFTPTTYSATFDGNGNITAVSITNATYYPEEPGFNQLEIVNGDRLVALDPGTNINDWDSIASSSQAINVWAFVESVSEAVVSDSISGGIQLYRGVAAPQTSIGASGDLPGDYAFDLSYMYFCTSIYDGSTNIWKRVGWLGDTW